MKQIADELRLTGLPGPSSGHVGREVLYDCTLGPRKRGVITKIGAVFMFVQFDDVVEPVGCRPKDLIVVTKKTSGFQLQRGNVTEEDIKRRVVYTAPMKAERGEISSFNSEYVFVRFDGEVTAKSCRYEDLRWEDDAPPKPQAAVRRIAADRDLQPKTFYFAMTLEDARHRRKDFKVRVKAHLPNTAIFEALEQAMGYFGQSPLVINYCDTVYCRVHNLETDEMGWFQCVQGDRPAWIRSTGPDIPF